MSTKALVDYFLKIEGVDGESLTKLIRDGFSCKPGNGRRKMPGAGDSAAAVVPAKSK